jgi:CDP-2,3-bis-(O-geranylgeranyl)-sn-glycerol synthase
MLAFAWTCAQALYLFAPLVFSAALSGIVLRYDLASSLASPIDGGRYLAGRRVLGDGKTWRGVVVAVVGSVVATSVQKLLPLEWTSTLAVVDYTAIDPGAFGAAMGAGAMLGELPNSFAKRRLGIARGRTARGLLGFLFYVLDQVDLLVGAWPMILPWVRPSFVLVAASIVVTLAVHPLVALIGYLMGARRSPR